MRNKSCTVKFFLYKKVKNKDKGFPVYARIRYDRKKAEFATGEYCQVAHWDETTGFPKKNLRLREHLIYIESKINEIWRNLTFEGKDISAKILRDYFKGKQQKEENQFFLNFFDDYLKRIENLPQDYAANTIKHYRTTRNHLEKFLNQKKVSIKGFDLELFLS